jgi:glucokinase
MTETERASYLAIEIGGTKLQLGIGADTGRLDGLWRATVNPARGADGIREQIVAGLAELLAQVGLKAEQLRGVGIGFGGPVDDATRSVIKSHQIAGWDQFPLADWISELVGLPAVLGNDADVAGLGEAIHGAGKGVSPMFYITLGSGIGGGLILNGEIYRGIGRGAAEIGHLQAGRGAQGEPIPLEQKASGWAIGRQPHSRLPAEHTAKDIAELAAAGDSEALAILDEAWDHLATGICHVIALLCPRRIVIGGGVSLMGEKLLFTPLRRMVAERVFRPFAGLTEIVPAQLGEEVVLHGAIALARKHLDEAATGRGGR